MCRIVAFSQNVRSAARTWTLHPGEKSGTNPEAMRLLGTSRVSNIRKFGIKNLVLGEAQLKPRKRRNRSRMVSGPHHVLETLGGGICRFSLLAHRWTLDRKSTRLNSRH